MRLLFIVPVNTAANEPLVDELTLKMVRALREGRPANYIYAGHHTCICGAKSGSTDIVLPNGWVTNTLCVHYVAYHRDEVPAADLEAVRRLPAGINDPSPYELHGPDIRRRRPATLVWTVNDFREELESEAVRWTYELVLVNGAAVAVDVTSASSMRSLDAVYTSPETVEAVRTLAPRDAWRVPHTAVFRLSEFRQGRSPAIAASLSAASLRAVTWEIQGEWEGGSGLYLIAVVRGHPSRPPSR